MKVPKDFMKLLQPYLDAGLVTICEGTKHRRIMRKDGNKRPLPGSPSDHRALLNFKSQLRQFAGPLPGETE